MSAGDKLTIKDDGAIALSARTVEKLLRARSGEAALLYLYLKSCGDLPDASGAARALDMTDERFRAALRALEEVGLLGETAYAPEETPAVQELPQYTAADVAAEMKNGTVFPALVEETERRFGRALSSGDLLALFGIYNGLGLPAEVILLLVTRCMEEYGERYGGKKPSMRYIEKAAYTWEKNGLFTLERAEEYIRHLDLVRSAEGAMKRALQIADRDLTASERGYVSRWLEMGFDAEAVELAYDKTVLNTGKRSWKYMNAIIAKWKEKGLMTVSAIRAAEEKNGEKPRKEPPAGRTSPDEANFVRMKERLAKKREQ